MECVFWQIVVPEDFAGVFNDRLQPIDLGLLLSDYGSGCVFHCRPLTTYLRVLFRPVGRGAFAQVRASSKASSDQWHSTLRPWPGTPCGASFRKPRYFH